MESLHWVLLAGLLLAAAIGFWMAWTIRGVSLRRVRAEADYLKDLWARTGCAHARDFAAHAAAPEAGPPGEDPAVRMGRAAASETQPA